MSDTLASMRRALRAARSAERRVLKHKMDRYNSLSGKTRSTENEYDAQRAKTTNDVIAETLAIASNSVLKGAAGRFSRLPDAATDKLLHECNVVQPEVRTLWQQKIGMVSMLSDDTRAKLAQMPRFSLREAKLNDLARWMVRQWCDIEGYDPAKHVK